MFNQYFFLPSSLTALLVRSSHSSLGSNGSEGGEDQSVSSDISARTEVKRTMSWEHRFSHRRDGQLQLDLSSVSWWLAVCSEFLEAQ